MRVQDIDGIDTTVAQELEKLLRQSRRVARAQKRIAPRYARKATQRSRQIQNVIFEKIQNIAAQLGAVPCFEATPKSTYRPHQLGDGTVVMRCGHSPFHTLKTR